jgi:hypothetical protein
VYRRDTKGIAFRALDSQRNPAKGAKKAAIQIDQLFISLLYHLIDQACTFVTQAGPRFNSLLILSKRTLGIIETSSIDTLD